MPRRPKSLAALPDIIALLGPPSSERFTDGADGADAPRTHGGWRWTCGCFALARGRDYLLMACTRHDAKEARERSAEGV